MIGKIQDYSKLTSNSLFGIRSQLNNVLAYKIMAVTPWTFYEKLDEILGSYGTNGFPLSTGKFYCMAFTSNKKLMMEPSTASWVKSSTVKIQEMIRDFVLESLHKAKGTKISDIELRSAANRAFNFVYDDASLRNAITVAPEILPILKTMQGKKNLTHGPNFQDTLNRTFLALGGMFPGTTEEFTSGVKLPDFKTSLKMAFSRSSETYNDEIKLDKILYEVSLNLMAGKLDNKEILQFLVNNLKFKMFVDERHNHMSREICIKANLRLNLIETYYTPLIAIRPNLAGLLN